MSLKSSKPSLQFEGSLRMKLLKTSMSFSKKRIGSNCEGGRSQELSYHLRRKLDSKMHRSRNNQRVERRRTLTRQVPQTPHGALKCMMMKRLISRMSSKKKGKRWWSKRNEMLRWPSSSLKTIYNAKRMK